MTEAEDVMMDVKPDMELEEFLQCVGIKLGLSEVTELEHYDEDFEKWLSVSETEDLELKNGAKYKVKNMMQEVCKSIKSK